MKLVLKHNKFYMESKSSELLKELMKDSVVQECIAGETLTATSALKEQAAADLTREEVFKPPTDDTEMQMDNPEEITATANPPPSHESSFPVPEALTSEQSHSLEIKPSKVHLVTLKVHSRSQNFHS